MILDSLGESLVKQLPEIKNVVPCGSQVLVELLTPQEQANTSIQIMNVDNKVPRQGYILAIGPSVNAESYGFKVGDRFLLSSSSAISAPNFGSDRERFLVEPHAIKAVLEEAK